MSFTAWWTFPGTPDLVLIPVSAAWNQSNNIASCSGRRLLSSRRSVTYGINGVSSISADFSVFIDSPLWSTMLLFSAFPGRQNKNRKTNHFTRREQHESRNQSERLQPTMPQRSCRGPKRKMYEETSPSPIHAHRSPPSPSRLSGGNVPVWRPGFFL